EPRRPDRHGAELPLRRTGDARDKNLRPALRLAELDLHPPQRDGRARRAHHVRQARAPAIRLPEDVVAQSLESIPNNVDLGSDRRNIFQVNVEEGRHLWAMVYLLHRYFGRDGREEADELLARRSGSGDKPRILNTFNEPIDDWLSFFMFTMFTDRDGKYQLSALAQSGFDPLARTTRFMLTEEAHHMFVGETGVDRVVQRCAELMAARKDPRKDHAVPFDLIQRYINFWFSLSLDLFGGEVSSNAADFFAAGLKGRFREDTLEEHKAVGQTYRMEVPEGGKLLDQQVPLRNAMNEVLRDEYVKDCQRGVDRWNKTLQ